ncbi:MAG: sigma-70 family RNA polymerase sigma factor [Armatimonadetes bacterium]|nr:sigma-70 family RNA polymerase sigma factor [Armatimonadota bacterium]
MPLSALQQRDPEAWRALYDTMGKRLHRLISRHLPREPDRQAITEDLVQETFVRAFANIAQFRGEARIATWLYAIALRVTRDFLRWDVVRRARGQLTESSARREALLEGILPDSGRSPEELLLRAEALGRVEQAIHEVVPPRLRAVLVQRYIEGLTVREMAQRWGMPMATVRALLAQARHSLAQRLQE